MSPITKREEAKEGGFAQIREALVSFEGDVIAQDARGNKTEFGMWGGKLIGEDGKPIPPKEYLQIVCANVVPLEVTEELSMDISEGWTFRVNCSDYKGSFWVDAFLLSADKNKVLIPEGLIGKRITFKRFTLEAREPKYNSTNYVIDKVSKAAIAAPKIVAKTTPAPAAAPIEEVAAEAVEVSSNDPMEIALELAVGKTEQQFRSAVALHPEFVNSPLLPLAKAGAITQTLVNDGKLKLVTQGNKQVYQKV